MNTSQKTEKVLNRLIISTRSPRGRFSAASSYPLLQKRMKSYIRRQWMRRLLPSAAAALLFFLSAWTVYLYVQPATLQTVVTQAETRTICLPDGSHVTLNHFSSLTYPEFQTSQREVTLNGEAEFEVSKDEKHPFIVHADAVDIQVLGTHFNVNAYRDNPDIKTTLLTGSVAITDKEHSVRLLLKPSEVAIYNKVEKKLMHQTVENATNAVAWRKGEFIFDNTPLQEIVRVLSHSFGTDILLSDDALCNYRITARFRNNEDLTTILSVLHDAGYFDYSFNGNQIIINIITKQDLK